MSEVNCTKCKHEGTEICEKCSVGPNFGLTCCACHISPPCRYCERLMFEVKETKEVKI